MHPDSPIQAFDLDGTPSRGAEIALEWWCEHCVSDHVAEILSKGKYVQWVGHTPPDGSVLVYSAGDNAWINVDPSALAPNTQLQNALNSQAAQLVDMQKQIAALSDCCNGSGSNGQTTLHDLLVEGPDGYGDYAVSGTAPIGPDSNGNYSITSLGVTGADANGNYIVTTH